MSDSPSPQDESVAAFAPHLAYEVHPAVEIRPEPFGALLYSFNTRRLSFLKDTRLVTVVRSLGDHPSARATLHAAGITDDREVAVFERALATLASTDTIRERQA